MIKYPNGKKYQPTKTIKQSHKAKEDISLSSSNRGMDLENDINLSNEYYRDHDICVIYKRPTPINIVKVDYSRGAHIVDAYFEKQSTTDYNGIYKGRYIDFEAKNTKNRTSFPLSNIEQHQIDHLKAVIRHGGVAFFIISFQTLNEIYLLDAKCVIEFYESQKRKSIRYDDIKKYGVLLKQGYNPRIDYLKAVDLLYFK